MLAEIRGTITIIHSSGAIVVAVIGANHQRFLYAMIWCLRSHAAIMWRCPLQLTIRAIHLLLLRECHLLLFLLLRNDKIHFLLELFQLLAQLIILAHQLLILVLQNLDILKLLIVLVHIDAQRLILMLECLHTRTQRLILLVAIAQLFMQAFDAFIECVDLRLVARLHRHQIGVEVRLEQLHLLLVLVNEFLALRKLHGTAGRHILLVDGGSSWWSHAILQQQLLLAQLMRQCVVLLLQIVVAIHHVLEDRQQLLHGDIHHAVHFLARRRIVAKLVSVLTLIAAG
mmetsp:Transcript_16648/g.25735  ORF Transcript_16648/g.25735 Transcript_16648/m.25735 type:complete len:285 (-) Transcript_16648:423-1277(-)